MVSRKSPRSEGASISANSIKRRNFKEVKIDARGRWGAILPALGIGSEFLKKEHGPCPACGGKDRFRFINENSDGTFYCNTLGGFGDGFDLIVHATGLTITDALESVSRFLGNCDSFETSTSNKSEKSESAEAKSKHLAKYYEDLWGDALDIQDGDVADKYFRSRGIREWNLENLCLHPGLTYTGENKSKFTFPAILAMVSSASGKNIGIHRTYLTQEGKKIPHEIGPAKKLMTGVEKYSGAAIRLSTKIEDVIGIGEGIETTLFCMQETGIPCWSGISSSLMVSVVIPETVKEVIIFGDNDKADSSTGKQAGQNAAFALARRLLEEGKKVKVLIPPTEGNDWLDEGKLPDLESIDYFTVDIDCSPVENFEDSEADQLEEHEQWPKIDSLAMYGVAGEIAMEAARETEVDPVAVLLSVLAFAGASFGSRCYLKVGESRQFARLFIALVGASSRARKGTSLDPVRRIFAEAESMLKGVEPLQTSYGPLSSGEGIVYAVRDASEEKNKKGELVDEGVEDKRILVMEGELGAPLKVMQREGNTLSAILRTAWDHGTIAPLTKSNRIKTTGAHINILGHITVHELAQLLSEVDAYNGFANRFLWVCVRRQKLVPLPKSMSSEVVSRLANKVANAIEIANGGVEAMELSKEVETIWIEKYHEVSQDEPGLLGAVTSRAEAQVLRLALIYALLDSEQAVKPVHLMAACALWDYCKQSARYLFRVGVTNIQGKILEALLEGDKTQTEINERLGKNVSSKELRASLSALEGVGRIQSTKTAAKGKGRPTLVWSVKI